MAKSRGHIIVEQWFKSKNWKWAAFQKEASAAYLNGKSGLINAPTGSGKTYSLWIPILIRHINSLPPKPLKTRKGLQVLWITPLRALSKDLLRNMETACLEMNLSWEVGIRTGDTATKERTRQKKQMPDALIITPESLHLLFSQKNSSEVFKNLHTVVVDEWHELMGSKRGVQTELALARLRNINPELQTWGISATIGNLSEAMQVLLGMKFKEENAVIIKANTDKKILVESILPEKVETLPWSGYMGIRLADKVVQIVNQSNTTLIFTNTRAQSEIWYRTIIEKYPEFAGIMALHHASLDREIRDWVEEALHNEKLKVVICTSSLDLGVDFRPVDTVIQVGSPKSIARFVQRAGRSGHRPGVTSKIYFCPANALELIEAVSLREGVVNNVLEDRPPVVHAFDVLAQWMITLAVGEGFEEQQLFEEVSDAYGYQYINRQEWEWLLGYITTGSPSLTVYDEYKKVERIDGRYVVKSRRIALRHVLSMGTIVSDTTLRVKFQHGKYLGAVEESFVTKLKPGDVFFFGGMSVEFVRIHEMTVTVKKAEGKKGFLVSWAGSRMALSSQLSSFIRERLASSIENPTHEKELAKLKPLLELQQERSIIPKMDELLIEQCETREGYHIFIFPFEGRLVHEGMSILLAYRLSRLKPITFSLAMNDYGFELLSDQYVDMKSIIKETNLFSTDHLVDDIYHSVNATEMAKRKFREIASIAGLMFQGYPGQHIKTKQIQASSSLLFTVMSKYEDNNLLVNQAFQEVLTYQLEEIRMRKALDRIATQKIIIRKTIKPTPFSFPIMVDRLREQLTSEKLEDRIQKMLKQYSNAD
ncbi:ligase-associated DNA damage response DEXH box helicase [Dyadobacter sediminis]|uniref:Ligase-associated DNA damage response DEXH box helicase n=1 Tax=Dyadobacter sediminis TaxID=1493691 RepID=A0A5R9K5L8_9BACT|nr:ligase-associated DNA damage response DEXH box helicase [Dyadobacter sediminis]TLU88851.1 ligase-associated DNA damage response DEXH box helicase [Dyadobacter sediminis]GGC13713.1 DNA ligase-associated DEXH box helicase [Dyadobacter sediminis]